MSFLTEEDVISFLTEKCRLFGESSAKIVVVNRTQSKLSITRNVRIAVVTSNNNTKLLDRLIKETLNEYGTDVYFIGSEVNYQNDLTVDYLMFEATIYANMEM